MNEKYLSLYGLSLHTHSHKIGHGLPPNIEENGVMGIPFAFPLTHASLYMGGRSKPAPVNPLVISLLGDIVVGLVLQIRGVGFTCWNLALMLPNLPTSFKAGYLNCKIRPYIPNPLHGFKCQSRARKLLALPLSKAYFEASKSSIVSSTQTDENIKKIKCPPLKFLQTASSILKPNISASIPAVSTSSFFTQARLLPSTIPESQPLIPTFNKSDPYT
ncbi:hypothetical protein TNCV_3464981 [Trichonephila clavipes]|nr:hypothetical protein TNCV_3464981 [Trichonephila clavipes]